MNKKADGGGFVKITGGEFRGRKIRTPGGNTHPMGERERIALFNILGDRVSGSQVIDLCCGGGTLAIEAVSRGAKFVLGVDSSSDAVAVASENMTNLGIYGTRGDVVRSDIAKIADMVSSRYDLVIADPPYDKFDEGMMNHLSRLVLDGGTLVLSHPNDEPPKFENMKLVDTRKYAGAHLSFYIKD